MPEIVLTTLNARYAHAAFGLRYLMANLGELQERAAIVEFDINQRPIDMLEVILAHEPRIVGVGVYIWNVEQATKLVADLKRVRPDILVVLGGPEVSYETGQQEIVAHADYVITGEADLAFADLCRKLLKGTRPLMKVIPAEVPEFAIKDEGGRMKDEQVTPIHPSSFSLHPSLIHLPYPLYSDEDVANRVIYVEASRGCPFECEFCLSSLDVPVRNVPTDAFLAAMQSLLDRGVRQFKFVDRTFNLNLKIGSAILRFFLERHTPGLFLHFEMIPDRLPDALREWIKQFPPGALQFEVGIQTFNEEVGARISRRQDNAKVAENLRFLREETGVHVHADLIVGLPGEDLESFARGFDKLVGMRPQEIQVGMLKRLRGTPIVRHDVEWAMVYSPHAPYEVLRTKTMDFATLQKMRRFARYWDLIANSGNFVESTPMLWSDGSSPFAAFMGLCEWMYGRAGRTHSLALQDLARWLFEYLTESRGRSPREVAEVIWRDYQRVGRSDRPEFMREYIAEMPIPRRKASNAPPRQARHLA